MLNEFSPDNLPGNSVPPRLELALLELVNSLHPLTLFTTQPASLLQHVLPQDSFLKICLPAVSYTICSRHSSLLQYSPFYSFTF